MGLFIRAVGQGRPLVLLHGWGFHSAIWNSLLPALSEAYRVFLVDLPGHGHSPLPADGIYSLDALAAQLAAELPDGIWLGWSLGGLLAQRIALTYPAKVQALALVASSPRFVQDGDWPCAMTRENLRAFGAQLRENGPATLNRFLALQVHGSAAARPLLKQLRADFKDNPAQPQALDAALALLENTDLRAELRRLGCPSWLCLGEKDTLVPACLASAWSALLPNQGTHSQCRIARAAHLPFLSHPADFMTHLQGFLHAVR